MRAFANATGAETFSATYKPQDMGWHEYTVVVLNEAARAGRLILFDLTYVQDLDNLLQGLGLYASTITATELRHIYLNWTAFGAVVIFYENGAQREAPWAKTLF